MKSNCGRNQYFGLHKPLCTRKSKTLAITTGLSMLLQMVYPVTSRALTGGPSSPEFSSFEPVATTNMVNEFSGQFIYNLPVLEIPGASGGGYALSLAYHGGDGPEAEASWVGAGWTLNPGSIIRNKKGLPDDYKGQNIKYYNSVPRNWTIAATGNVGGQAFSNMPYSVSASLSGTVRYNNYRGFGITAGVGLTGCQGLLSLNYSNTDGAGSFSAGINPGAILGMVNAHQKEDNEGALAQVACESPKKNNSGCGQAALSYGNGLAGSVLSTGISSYANYLLTSSTSPYNLTPYSGQSWEGYVHLTGDPGPIPIGLTGGLSISYTYQDNAKERNVPGYGYMYAGNGVIEKDNNRSEAESINDYTVENASTFNQRDKYLPVPSSTPDAYMVSGEGLSGGFRMYNNRIGVFSPNFVESYTLKRNFGLDIHLGGDVGVGGDITILGDHNLKVQSSWPHGNGNTDDNWFTPYDYQDDAHTESENMFFRFNNDLGGKLVYDNTNSAVAAVIDGGEPHFNTGGPLTLKQDTKIPGDNRRSGRASYIGYHTNREITTFSGTLRPLAYEQREDINILAGRIDSNINKNLRDEIGEVSVVNEGGNRYTYGLPVYTAGEKSIRNGLIGGDGDKFIVHSNVSTDIKVGEEYVTAYAAQYLLTEITTPDYLDINGNGPDEGDYGGYTKFSYKRQYGGDNKGTYASWYKWRTPYNGLTYAPNRLSDNTDDMGGYQSGYKEVYYLDSIKTKTHYAVFITEDRQDGYDAHPNDNYAAGYNVKGSNKPKCLKEIKLYAKSTHTGDPDVLVKTIHFDYNYECWPNNNNTVSSGAGSGKLTLKKVWFEYNGVINAKISPYQFEYNYPTVSYPTEYQFIQDQMTAGGALVQNPNYTPYIDCWGNYMDDGYARRQLMKGWDPQVPSNSFDPAAWQLKRIILPSGGEIHVQYEQNTYSYVQDRAACALVSLIDNDQNVAQGSLYTLNTAEIGANSDSEKDSLVALVNRTCHDQKMFFKFFYTLRGLSTANIGDCNGDYIEGYVNFVNCYRGGTGASAKVYVQVDGLPRQVCKDYIHYEIGGKLKDGSCQEPELPGDLGLGGSSSDIPTALGDLATTFFNKVYSSLPGTNICMRAKADVSYLRIPIPKKKGGGIRVKRLLMYNRGVDVNSPTLYGTEYIYENESNGRSFGVATNEPFENKGENPLVTFLPKRAEQSNWDRIIAGRDREKFEGPVSWNILPAPSIGYSRIIKRNIYQSQSTGTGYTVVDYNTVKDYPFDGNYGALGVRGTEQTPVQNVKDEWNIEFGFFDYTIRTGIKSSQGYCFIQNQMHGQVKQISDYRGEYIPAKFYSLTTPPVPVSQKTYKYFEPGEAVPMYDFDNWSIYYDRPGKETDITIDRRSVQDHSMELKVTGDITIGLFGFIPILYPIAIPLNSEADQKMSSIVTNKVIHYPAILKQMSVMKDGYYQVSDYTAFDPLTTKPVLTSTYDGFHGIHGLPLDPPNPHGHNGTYTAYNVPASSNYLAMGQKAWNERYYYYNSSGIGVTGSGGTYTLAGINAKHAFTEGDLLALHYHITGSSYDGVVMAHVVGLSGTNVIVTPTLKYNATIPGSGYYKAEVVQSGYTNQLGSSMDGFTTYGDDHDAEVNAFLAVFKQKMDLAMSGASPQHIDMAAYSFMLSSTCAGASPGWYIPGGPAGSCPDCDTNHKITSFDMYGSTGAINVYAGAASFSYSTFFGGSGSYGVRFVTTPSGAVMLNGYDLVTNADFNLGNIKPILCKRKTLHVIKAQATTYSDHWSYDGTYGIDTVGLNHYESGVRGKWRPFETYVFREKVLNGSQTALGQRNYNYAGTALFDLDKWSGIYLLHPNQWIRSNHIDAYSPNGHATQEFDAENIYSAAKYGYHGILPYVVSQNAKTASIHFESFENVYSSGSVYKVEDQMTVDNASVVKPGHTGKYGYKRSPTQEVYIPAALDYTGKGLTLRFWAKIANNPGIFSVTPSITGASATTVNYIARAGEWALYEAVWKNPGLTNPSVSFTIKNTGPYTYILDDIRVQPTEAKITSYVYDIATYKLAAVLDDQHFATFYQYNGEGKLVRTLVETMKGVKTVEESQYHVPLIPRP